MKLNLRVSFVPGRYMPNVNECGAKSFESTH